MKKKELQRAVDFISSIHRTVNITVDGNLMIFSGRSKAISSSYILAIDDAQAPDNFAVDANLFQNSVKLICMDDEETVKLLSPHDKNGHLMIQAADNVVLLPVMRGCKGKEIKSEIKSSTVICGSELVQMVTDVYHSARISSTSEYIYVSYPEAVVYALSPYTLSIRRKKVTDDYTSLKQVASFSGSSIYSACQAMKGRTFEVSYAGTRDAKLVLNDRGTGINICPTFQTARNLGSFVPKGEPLLVNRKELIAYAKLPVIFAGRDTPKCFLETRGKSIHLQSMMGECSAYIPAQCRQTNNDLVFVNAKFLIEALNSLHSSEEILLYMGGNVLYITSEDGRDVEVICPMLP